MISVVWRAEVLIISSLMNSVGVPSWQAILVIGALEDQVLIKLQLFILLSHIKWVLIATFILIRAIAAVGIVDVVGLWQRIEIIMAGEPVTILVNFTRLWKWITESLWTKEVIALVISIPQTLLEILVQREDDDPQLQYHKLDIQDEILEAILILKVNKVSLIIDLSLKLGT